MDPSSSKEWARLMAGMDQKSKAFTDATVPFVSSVFRAFCDQEGVTREEAMALTRTLLHVAYAAGGPPKA